MMPPMLNALQAPEVPTVEQTLASNSRDSLNSDVNNLRITGDKKLIHTTSFELS